MGNVVFNSKKKFNQFFQKDLYGKFDSDDNIILSRGGWNDEYVKLPRIVSYCISYTLKKHWVGYSDSLGHKNTLNALCKLVNVSQGDQKYKVGNLALTIGNVVTTGLVFRELSKIFPKGEVVSFVPFYPPILKSISYYFKKIHFTSSLKTEEEIIKNIDNLLSNKKIKILFLSNCIGVEGRVFSENFWEKMLARITRKGLYLVIDEGLWFSSLAYPETINNDRVIRMVSLSKKLGIPGCKLGYMVAGEKFISAFYDMASTNYGGPLSVFFLLAEFIYQFEYISSSQSSVKAGIKVLRDNYGISESTLLNLYENFVLTNRNNLKRLEKNHKVFSEWLDVNKVFFREVYDFGGLNVFLEPKTNKNAYEIFLRLIKSQAVSLMPSSCFGDVSDTMLRITLLEKTDDLKLGLKRIHKVIREIC